MPALTQLIKRGLSSTSLTGKKSEKEPGRTLVSAEASSTLKFEDYYTIDRPISKGSFGVVSVTQHKLSGKEFAVKVIERAKLSEKERLGVEREVSILKDCRDVVNIVQLVDFFSSPEHFYVVQVYAQGGDVFERLAQRASYTENDARNLAKHLLEAIEVLHSRKLAHRDLKPENLLLRDFLDDSSIVVADFGFASYVPEGGLKTRCGTPAFVGPEVLAPNCRYDERCDMWSVGCLLYMLIAGYPPFQDRNHRGLFKKVRGADYVFHDTYWKNVSVPAKQLIASLLTIDPNYRCTARSALDSGKWLKMDEHLLKTHDLSASLGEIKKFHARRTLKGAMHAVMWSVKHKCKSAGDVDSSEHTDDEWDKEGTAANLNEDGSARTRDPLVKENSDSILLRTVRPMMGFHDIYETGELIHNGQTAKVYECIHRKTRTVFAVKVIERKQRSRKSVKRTMAETVLHEVAVLDSLKHNNIIQVEEFFEDDEHFFLVMERMRGGDVFDRLLQLKKYSEEDARTLARTLVSAVSKTVSFVRGRLTLISMRKRLLFHSSRSQLFPYPYTSNKQAAYFHSQKIAHRDLKPQNLLLKSKDDSTDIMISDFGFACRVHTPQSLTTRCGTRTY
jgi:serine/threonine protein kinase